MIYYLNENHWVLKPQNSLFWYDSVHKWLREYIGDGPDVRPASAQAAAN